MISIIEGEDTMVYCESCGAYELQAPREDGSVVVPRSWYSLLRVDEPTRLFCSKRCMGEWCSQS